MNGRRRWWRPTIRVRLTVLYAAAFFVAGAVLVLFMYLYMILNHQSGQASVQHLAPDIQHAVTAQVLQDRQETLNTMLVASLVMLGVFGVVATGFGWLLAGRALEPLQQITATARRVADRSLHERIALEGPNDEIKELADTFDGMLERLDRAFDSQRRFVANASHELRTPLTINRTLIEVAIDSPDASESLRQLGANLLAVNQRHERLIDGLLTLAGSEQRLIQLTAVDLADIARHITTESQDSADMTGIEIRSSLGSAPVSGNPALLERLVHNLIDNAIRYNLSEKGWISIRTGTDQGQALSKSKTPGPPSPRMKLPTCSSPSAACLAMNDEPPAAALDLACPSCAQWRTPIRGMSRQPLEPRAASVCEYDYQPPPAMTTVLPPEQLALIRGRRGLPGGNRIRQPQLPRRNCRTWHSGSV